MAIIVLVFSKTIPLFNKLGSSFNNVSNYSSFIQNLNNTINSIQNEKKENLNNEKNVATKEDLNGKKLFFHQLNLVIQNLLSLY